MPQKFTRRAALALMGSGACLALTETTGFISVTADRGTEVTVADDLSAYLTLKDLSNVDTVPKFTNNAESEMSVTLSSSEDVDFDVDDDETNDGSNPTFSLPVSQTREVDVLGDGDIPVDITATLLDNNGNQVGSIELTRTVEAQTQAGQVQITQSYKAPGGSGKYEFGLENTGSIDVTITELKIRETTNQNAVRVGGKNNDDILVNESGTQLTSEVIDVGGDFVALDPDINLPTSAGEKTFEFLRFRDTRDKNVKMDGEEVALTLKFEDSSELEIRITP